MMRTILTAAAGFLVAVNTAFALENKDAGPSDAEIAHIAYTAGLIDISYAEIALEKSENADVRAFAETMKRDHTAVNEAALDLLNKLGVAPQDNATSQTLSDEAEAKRAEFKALSGAAFDKAYAENELAYHQFVNGALEDSLIPAADSMEFKDLLGVALKTFKTHEQHAEQLVEAMQ